MKAEGLASKLKVRPVSIKGRIMFQATKTVGTKEIHENLDPKGVAGLICDMIDNAPSFGQLEMKNAENSATILISRKGHVTIKERRQKAENAKNGKEQDREQTNDRKKSNKLEDGGDIKRQNPIIDGNTCPGGISVPASVIGGPDRKKKYILPEGEPVPFLVELGVMNNEGYVVKARYDKFRQINRYLEFVNDVIPELERRSGSKADHSSCTLNKCLEIIDFGCGKSYLTFALYHFLHESKGLNVHITGLDLKKDVIADCSRLAQRLGYTDLEFKHGDIADYETTGGVDMVVTLHACDTATDYALYNAIRWNAGVIFCVPCCQHELNKQIKNKELESVLKYGIIKERISALITDAIRAEMLEEKGYKTQILEFIDMEHTPKNLLIRAVKRAGAEITRNGKDHSKYEQLLDSLSSELTLHRLLKLEDS
ncbi:MAG: SAM-dependent methyltransferase [Lachnospiraceae bacterium]|nr:SAM-dependent methyltransferase [Lachnospiraceae bacterium]